MQSISLTALTLALTAGAAFAGNLTPPPGAPSSTMKTLQEVEPRTPIQSVPGAGTVMHVISQSGSYYLTGNLVVPSNGIGIQVSADNVTIDLNGFSIIGTSSGANALNGIHVPSVRRYLTVKNGTVRFFGSECVNAANVIGGRFENLAIFDSQGNHGIRVGDGAVVRGVRAESNNVAGIFGGASGTFTDCVAIDNGGDGIAAGSYATVNNCTALNNGQDGISSNQRSTVMNCSSNGNFGDGIEMSFGGIVKNCTASFNGQGIRVDAGGAVVVLENEVSNNTGAGILVAAGQASRIDSNHIGFNGQFGVRVLTADNFIVRNTARSNVTNYSIVAGNEAAAVISNPGDAFTSSNAWANFAY
ncbi:MAG: right-handed parallel beta-helix repeat-containing protein [Phycisphaerales bacterium]|nr:right-handed parallel beta-helix repeat-containing protein [Phycisphaerales bacterium]